MIPDQCADFLLLKFLFFFISPQYGIEVKPVSKFARNEIFLSEELKRRYDTQILTSPEPSSTAPWGRGGRCSAHCWRQRTLSETAARRAENDLLGSLMDPEKALTDYQICDTIIGVIFGRNTTASTGMLTYLADDPELLEAVAVRSDDSPILPCSPIRHGANWPLCCRNMRKYVEQEEQGDGSLTWA